MNDNFELDKNLYELLQKGSLEVITLINLGGISSIELYADIHTVKRSPNENSIIVIPFWVNNEPVYLKIYFDKTSAYNNKVFDELIPMTSVDMQVLPRWNIESNCIEFDFDGLLEGPSAHTIHPVQYCHGCNTFTYVQDDDDIYECCTAPNDQRETSHEWSGEVKAEE